MKSAFEFASDFNKIVKKLSRVQKIIEELENYKESDILFVKNEDIKEIKHITYFIYQVNIKDRLELVSLALNGTEEIERFRRKNFASLVFKKCYDKINYDMKIF